MKGFTCFSGTPRGEGEDGREYIASGDSVTDFSPREYSVNAKLASFTASPQKMPLKEEVRKTVFPRADKGFEKFDPSRRFVRQLCLRSDMRTKLAELIKENSLGEAGDQQIIAYINDAGFDIQSIQSLRKALDEARNSDLLFWASRYNLFVLWSADRQHPWDSHPEAEKVAATFEIGRQQGSTDEVVALLDGVRVTNFDFSNSVFKTRSPVEWKTPSGDIALVNLELRMTSFSGYSKREAVDEGKWAPLAGIDYVGPQAHGTLWLHPDEAIPANWPVAPPIVAGKVNIAARKAAISPGSIDDELSFKGTYTTFLLPEREGLPATQSVELKIAASAGAASVTVNGQAVDAYDFHPNNLLSWEGAAGYTAQLQFMHLPNGPVFMGRLQRSEETAIATGFNVFGQLKEQSTCLPPSSRMDAIVGQKLAAGLGTASTLLIADAMASAAKTWTLRKKGSSKDEIHNEHNVILMQLEHEVNTILYVEDLCRAAGAMFLPGGAADVTAAKDIDHDAAAKAKAAQAEAAKFAANAAAEADKAEKEARETEEDYKNNLVPNATHKASQAAWKAAQAAEEASKAELASNDASAHAAFARTAASLDHALLAAQAFNEARDLAFKAAKAEKRAANVALLAVEGGIDHYSKSKAYDKLREISEAASVAKKALESATAAVEGWEANSVASRAAALKSAQAAMEHSIVCYKHMRKVQPTQA